MTEKNKMPDYGTMVVSLDFELLWGVIDHRNQSDYGRNVKGGREAVRKMLNVFHEYGIHATWGIVGFLVHENVEDCKRNCPAILPEYDDRNLSSYNHFAEAQGYDRDCLFAPDLVSLIAQSANQEIASHTYSHYYCVEKGQTEEAFSCDTEMAGTVLSQYCNHVCSIIFPRNQFNSDYAQVLKNNGIKNYRGNELTWYYRPMAKKGGYNNVFRRMMRLLDTYVSLSGSNCYDYQGIVDKNGLNNIRSSRFFRPYTPKMKFLESLRLHRIKGQMRNAAINHQVFHIWWHPHNFGDHITENMNNLISLLEYYKELEAEYGFRSMNMGEIGNLYC